MKTMKPKIMVNGDVFILVDAEKLSHKDVFMQYEPQTQREYITKVFISDAITKGVKNFYRPECDPSFTEDGKGICFAPRKKPAVGKCYIWWKYNAKKYCTEKNSRLGTRLEYYAFLGVLIKNLIIEGWTVEEAWDAVCNNSRKLGHYSDSENARPFSETTGSRRVCDFCDLANIPKILSDDVNEGVFWLVSGFFLYSGDFFPLAILEYREFMHDYDYFRLGWVVLS